MRYSALTGLACLFYHRRGKSVKATGFAVSTVDAQPDFAPPACACPTCGVECRRHSVYTRNVRDVSLDGPTTIRVRVGNYRCKGCAKFFKPELPFAAKGKHYSTRATRKATVAVQEDKTTYTALTNRLSRDFSIRPSKSTCWDWFQEFAGNIDIEGLPEMGLLPVQRANLRR